MKFLLTVHQFLPDFSAGTEVLTYSVAKELMNRGFEVRIITAQPETSIKPEDNKCFEEFVYDGIHIYRYYNTSDTIALQLPRMTLDYDNVAAANFFAQVLDNFKPDIVHFFHLSRLGTGLITKAVERNIPAFLTATDFWAICPKAQISYANGKECLGPSPDAGNCALHLAAKPFGQTAENLTSFFPTGISDFLVRKIKDKTILSSFHTNEVQALNKRLPKNIQRLNLLRKIIVPNGVLESRLLQHGISSDKISKSAYGIKINNLISRRNRFLSNTPLKVAFIGTLAPHKGCHILIKAFKLLDSDTFTLKIYGSELDFPKYSRQLRRESEGTSNIEFLGTFPNDAIEKIFEDIDVLVVPSTWTENTPLIIYSAQASGCPVIASDVQGIAEAVVHGVNGLLFERGNATALYKNLVSLIQTPEMLQTLSQNSKTPKSIESYVDHLMGIWSEQNNQQHREQTSSDPTAAS